MSWERALEADARLAAKNALKIRAAIAQSFDAQNVYERYLITQPNKSNNPAQDRARARAWVILNVNVNMQPLKEVMIRVWAEGYVTGEAFADEQIQMAREIKKATDTYVDWANWKPGDRAAALLLRPPDAFKRLLESQGITFKEFSDTTVRDIGNAVADAVDLGLSATRSAKNIQRHVASASRALSIAITEQNRAISYATVSRYKEAGLEQMEWEVSSPCDKCAQNANQVVPIGGTFNSGVTQPPQHPHCRCVLLPVIPDFAQDAHPISGGIIAPPAQEPIPIPKPEAETEAFGTASMKFKQIEMRGFEPGKWTILDRETTREAVIVSTMRIVVGGKSREWVERFFTPERISRADKAMVEKGIVYKNGRLEVHFGSDGLKTTEAQRQMVLQEVEKLQLSNPKERAVVHINKNSSGKYGWAYGGQSDLWVTPRVVKNPELGAAEKGDFKMPTTAATTQLQYTLTHEWGHLIDDIKETGSQTLQRQTAIGRLQDAYPNEFKSRYSGKNDKEFYAEMFTEFYATGGQTPNLLVQAMAKEFGWKVPEVELPKPKPVAAPKPKPVKKVGFKANAAKHNSLEDWDKAQVWTLSKIKDNVAEPVKIWDGGAKEYITTYRQVGDPRLKAILKAQGFTAKPKVVTTAQFEVLAEGGATRVYRGITPTSTKTAPEMIKDFKEGDMFVGTGVIGNGVYAGTDLNYVIKYAGDNKDNVIEILLSPNAKVITKEAAEEGAQKLSTAFYDKAFGRKYSDPEMGKIVDGYVEMIGDAPIDYGPAKDRWQKEFRELGWTFKDPGAYAAANGYDAIKYVDEDGGVFVILNRGAVVVKE
jgi:SPP1 gp7 family putative phage head morphogenesis protein